MMMESNSTELAMFHRFVGEQLAGGVDWTPEECVRLWRAEQPSPEELDDSVASVRRALDQAERGEGKSLADFDRDFRAIHRIGSTS